MEGWVLQLLLVAVPAIINKLGDLLGKVFTEKHTPTFRKITQKPCMKTAEQIRAFGIKKGIVYQPKK